MTSTEHFCQSRCLFRKETVFGQLSLPETVPGGMPLPRRACGRQCLGGALLVRFRGVNETGGALWLYRHLLPYSETGISMDFP